MKHEMGCFKHLCYCCVVGFFIFLHGSISKSNWRLPHKLQTCQTSLHWSFGAPFISFQNISFPSPTIHSFTPSPFHFLSPVQSWTLSFSPGFGTLYTRRQNGAAEKPKDGSTTTATRGAWRNAARPLSCWAASGQIIIIIYYISLIVPLYSKVRRFSMWVFF